MYKKILAIITGMLLLVPAAQAAVTAPEDFNPGNSIMTVDFQLSGKIKTLLEPLIRAEMEKDSFSSQEGAEKAVMLTNKFLAGEKFFMSATLPESFFFSFPITDSEWDTLIKDTESHEYGSVMVYTDTSSGGSPLYMAHLGGFAVLSPDKVEPLHAAIDLADGKTTDSLTANTAYKSATSAQLSPRLLGLSINFSSFIGMLSGAAGALGGSSGREAALMQTMVELLQMIDWESISVADSPEGYKFNMKLLGNAEKIKELGFSFSPGGSFTPNLYKKFPNAAPLLYSESFNPKANYEQSKKMMNTILDAADGDELPPNFDFMAVLEHALGLPLNELYAPFEKEFAFGVQYDSVSPLPYLTLMGNVSGHEEDAKKLVGDLVKKAKKAFKESNVRKEAYTITTTNGFTKFAINLTEIEEDYNGPPFPVVTVTAGVTADGRLIVSNFPGAENGTGFALAETGDNTGIFYLNMRNVWGFIDAMTAWAEAAGGGEHGPPLEFYQGYYSVLEAIYGWRDLLVVTTGNETDVLVTGTVAIDSEKHKTYAELVQNLKTSDRDNDGVSDYDERYVYFTPVDSADSDDDGVSDFEELRKGANPRGQGRLWQDVPEEEYYTDEAAFLYQRGAIKGYDDGTFKGGNLVNRAEFTTMIIKAFEQDTSNYLGVDVELSQRRPPFKDVGEGDWFYPFVAKSYRAGFVAGSYDAHAGGYIFRPGDPISRAEAITILNRASSALGKTQRNGIAKCQSNKLQFQDVSSKDWFCDEVENAYANGITRGKAEGQFKPNDLLSRGEAAVMIKRTMEIDAKVLGEGTTSLGELVPISGALRPAGNLLR